MICISKGRKLQTVIVLVYISNLDDDHLHMMFMIIVYDVMMFMKNVYDVYVRVHLHISHHVHLYVGHHVSHWTDWGRC